MRFGIALPQYDFSLPGKPTIDWRDVRDWAIRAERLGFDSVWVSDHLFFDLVKYGGPPGSLGVMECFTTLAAIAASTQRVRLGSLVACNDLRSPALVAKMAATLDVLSAGRVEIGIGAGWYQPEYRAAGIPFDPPGIRIERLAEAVQVVTGMLSGDSFSFAGKHYTLKDAWNLPRAVQSPRPPVWVGGKGDRVASIAGRYADGFNSVWAWTPKDFAGRIELVESAAEKAGRDPSAIRKSVGLYTLPGTSDADIASRWNRYTEATPSGVTQGMEFKSWAGDKLAGTPDRIEQTLRSFEALGVEEVILGFGLLPFQLADEEAVEFFAAEIFQRFK